MAARKISQREARALRKCVQHLEGLERARLQPWAGDWPGGVHLCDIEVVDGGTQGREVLTARKLGHAVVVVPDTADPDTLRLFALPLAGGRT